VSAAPFIRLDPRDNVAVALRPLNQGQAFKLGDISVTLAEPVACGHKFALRALAEGENVIKFGEPIGHATKAISAGGWVHVHNLKTNLAGTETYSYNPVTPPPISAPGEFTFDSFVRSNGDVGIRNELWIIPTVGCVNEIAEALAREFQAQLPPGGAIEGVYAFKHPYGCSQLGEDHENTQKILAGLARHPNAGGVLIVGLGCENNTMESFRKVLGDADPQRYRFMVTQLVENEMEAGMELLAQLAEAASKCRRQPVPASKLRVGLKCGGSDGFSGITANPLVGRFSDLLVARGGSTVLTEVPEMFGAETLFMNRCPSRELFEQCVGMINGFKEYFLRHNQVVYENPSPGNKDGGISTLEEKSLGCTQKGGTSLVADVLPYGGQLRRPGLTFLSGPGNDIVATTVLAAAGTHLVLFTTGRGTPLGGPVPTVKISTNSDLARRKPRWIDFDAGRLLDGAAMENLANEFFAQVLEYASGRRRTRAEINGFREIAIFKGGVTL
jgi:altronate hydrolase